jgi:hypothetical protein
MKSVAILATLLILSAPAFADADLHENQLPAYETQQNVQPVTRAEVKAELVKYEKEKQSHPYNRWDDIYFGH